MENKQQREAKRLKRENNLVNETEKLKNKYLKRELKLHDLFHFRENYM